jgi:hypothetical protein
MNPYSEPQVNAPLTGNDLFGNFRFIPVQRKQRERGELLKYFCRKLGKHEKKDIGFVALKVTGMTMQDMYYLKSICDQYENEGKGSWGKCFHGSLKVR